MKSILFEWAPVKSCLRRFCKELGGCYKWSSSEISTRSSDVWDIYKSFHHHHHHHSGWEDRFGGFFFLDTTKSWLHLDFFTAIFLFHWFWAFSRQVEYGTKFDEDMRPWRARSKRWPDLGFIDHKAVGELVCWHANTVPCELKLALAERHLVSKMI